MGCRPCFEGFRHDFTVILLGGRVIRGWGVISSCLDLALALLALHSEFLYRIMYAETRWSVKSVIIFSHADRDGSSIGVMLGC